MLWIWIVNCEGGNATVFEANCVCEYSFLVIMYRSFKCTVKMRDQIFVVSMLSSSISDKSYTQEWAIVFSCKKRSLIIIAIFMEISEISI